MLKLLWFSRHELNVEQLADLTRIYGELVVTRVNRTIQTAKELAAEIEAADVVAVVAPLTLQAELLQLCKEKPLLICKNDRIIDPTDGSKVSFQHAGWFRVKEVRVEIEQL